MKFSGQAFIICIHHNEGILALVMNGKGVYIIEKAILDIR